MSMPGRITVFFVLVAESLLMRLALWRFVKGASAFGTDAAGLSRPVAFGGKLWPPGSGACPPGAAGRGAAGLLGVTGAGGCPVGAAPGDAGRAGGDGCGLAVLGAGGLLLRPGVLGRRAMRLPRAECQAHARGLCRGARYPSLLRRGFPRPSPCAVREADRPCRQLCRWQARSRRCWSWGVPMPAPLSSGDRCRPGHPRPGHPRPSQHPRRWRPGCRP